MILTNTKALRIASLMLSLVVLSSAPAMAQESESSQEDRRAAFDACLTELGIERPAEGQRPQAMGEDVRTQIDACMKEKGFDPPKHRPGEHGPRHGRGGAQ